MLGERSARNTAAFARAVQNLPVGGLEPDVAGSREHRHGAVLPGGGLDQLEIAVGLGDVNGSLGARSQATLTHHIAVDPREDGSRAAIDLQRFAKHTRGKQRGIDAVQGANGHVAGRCPCVVCERARHHLTDLQHIVGLARDLIDDNISGCLNIQATARIFHSDRDITVCTNVGHRTRELDIPRHSERIGRERNRLKGFGRIVRSFGKRRVLAKGHIAGEHQSTNRLDINLRRR